MRAINHIDGRRALLPRDYFADHAFGVDSRAIPLMPAGGDEPSARIAWVQHNLACRYRQARGRPSGAALGRTYGFSRSVFSDSLRGARWMGETVMVALLDATR